jgi:hypothetical protein
MREDFLESGHFLANSRPVRGISPLLRTREAFPVGLGLSKVRQKTKIPLRSNNEKKNASRRDEAGSGSQFRLTGARPSAVKQRFPRRPTTDHRRFHLGSKMPLGLTAVCKSFPTHQNKLPYCGCSFAPGSGYPLVVVQAINPSGSARNSPNKDRRSDRKLTQINLFFRNS